MADEETRWIEAMLNKGRRRLLTMGGAAMAGMVLTPRMRMVEAASYTDADVLNFALNLEYLEANFYYLAAFGCTINQPNAAAMAAGAPAAGIPITGVGTQGTVTGGSQVPFSAVTTGAYATEVAIEEGRHVLALQNALGTAAVAQPAINLGTVWAALATKAGVSGGASFSPYANDAAFLVGAFVLEDVGVTAYAGAAGLLTSAANLEVAAGVLGEEAYHAGLIRTSLTVLDPTGSLGLVAATTQIAALRAQLAAAAAGSTTSAYDPSPDDVGIGTASVSLAGVGSSTATQVTDANAGNAIASVRSTTQVLNIVTAGGAIAGTSTVSPALGGFFPAGMNGLFR